MATEVEIYNAALSHIGAKANVSSLTDASVERQKCTQFYAKCLRTALTYHPWSFATNNQVLAAVTNDTEAWDYKYAKPNLCIRPLAMLDEDATSYQMGLYYLEQGDFLYTNIVNAELRFLYYEDNPGKYSPDFEDALGYLLASRIAGPIIKGAMGRQERDAQYKAYRISIATAAATDANASQNPAPYTPASIMARSGMSSIMALDDAVSFARRR